jgi:uncharacterized protein (DUF885 family)
LFKKKRKGKEKLKEQKRRGKKMRKAKESREEKKKQKERKTVIHSGLPGNLRQVSIKVAAQLPCIHCGPSPL